MLGGGTLPTDTAKGPGSGFVFDPRQAFDPVPFVIAAAAILVISFLARVIQPSAPRVGVYAVKPMVIPIRMPKRSPQLAKRVFAAAARRRPKWRPQQLGNMASKYARIVFGLLS